MAIASPLADLPSGRRVRDVYGDLWSVRDGRMVCLTAQRPPMRVVDAAASGFGPFEVDSLGEGWPMSETTTPTDRAGLQALARENGWAVRDSVSRPALWWATRVSNDEDLEEVEIRHGADGQVAGGVWWVNTSQSALHSAEDVRATLEWKG